MQLCRNGNLGLRYQFIITRVLLTPTVQLQTGATYRGITIAPRRWFPGGLQGSVRLGHIANDSETVPTEIPVCQTGQGVLLPPGTPALCSVQLLSASLAVTNGAGYNAAVAQNSIVATFGSDLASPGGGTAVTVTDSGGTARAAALFYADPQQIAFTIPAGTATGPAAVTVTTGDGTVSATTVQVLAVAPGRSRRTPTGKGSLLLWPFREQAPPWFSPVRAPC